MLASPIAKAELQLETWTSYGAMAEQGGVCAAFARIMELQGAVDKNRGKIWLERRKFSGAIVRQASILEGLPAANASEIDQLVNRYSMWLLTNLASGDEAQMLDPDAHAAASQMVEEVCASLYDRADKAIFEKNPELKICPEPTVVEAPNTCVASKSKQTNQDSDAKKKIAILLRNNMTLTKELNDLNDELSTLRNTRKTTTVANDGGIKDTSQNNKQGEATGIAKKKPVKAMAIPSNLPVSKPKNYIPKMARNTIVDETTAASRSQAINSRSTGKIVGVGFAAQLGSYRSNAGAKAGIEALRAEFPMILATTELSVVKANIGGGSTLYRVVSGSLSRIDATQLCNALWNKKFGCLIKASN